MLPLYRILTVRWLRYHGSITLWTLFRIYAHLLRGGPGQKSPGAYRDLSPGRRYLLPAVTGSRDLWWPVGSRRIIICEARFEWRAYKRRYAHPAYSRRYRLHGGSCPRVRIWIATRPIVSPTIVSERYGHKSRWEQEKLHLKRCLENFICATHNQKNDNVRRVPNISSNATWQGKRTETIRYI